MKKQKKQNNKKNEHYLNKNTTHHKNWSIKQVFLKSLFFSVNLFFSFSKRASGYFKLADFYEKLKAMSQMGEMLGMGGIGMKYKGKYMSPFTIAELPTKEERLKEYSLVFSAFPDEIESNIENPPDDVLDDSFGEFLEIWVVRMRSEFGSGKQFTEENMQAGVIENLLIPCLDHPTKYLAPYSFMALTAAASEYQEARRRIMAVKDTWFKRACLILREGMVTEINGASALFYVLLQYSPWRQQFTPEEKKLCIQSLRVAEKFKLKQFLKEVANPQGDPHPFQRRGEEMWPHLQTDIIYPMGGVKKMKEMGPDYVQNLNLLAIRSIGMLEGRIPIDHDDAISLDEVPRCSACSSMNPSKKCACQEARYCNQTCQRVHWRVHKNTCAARKKK